MKYDGHVHSPFCPHGSPDLFEEYIERALQFGMEEISFTEHAPLPQGFIDPTPAKDSGMDPGRLQTYIDQLHTLKRSYRNKIKINIGLEVDYIEGYEEQTKMFLDETGPFLDDSILSVHFIKNENKWHCLDFSAEMFGCISRQMGSVEKVYERYYATVEKSIHSNLGKHKPERIGHITLVHKFQQQFPISTNLNERVFGLLGDIHRKHYSLDYNGAGVAKPLCGEPYPPERFIRHAVQLGIRLVYGSDAHQAKDLGQGYEALCHTSLLTSPTSGS